MSLLDRLVAALRAPPAADVRPQPDPPRPARPPAPDGAANHVIVVLDSCRFDSFIRAKPRHMTRLGEVQRRWTYASWTAPSHYNLLIGLLPHESPRNVYASEYYKQDFLRFRERLNFDVSFAQLVPNLWLPGYLRSVGYRTGMYVSMPVLNPATPINRDFDDYALMDRHNDIVPMIRRLRFYEERPSFYVLNTGETHYPYATPDEPENHWPRISGVNGVFKHLDDHLRAGQAVHAREAEPFFDADRLTQLHARQVDAVRWVDRAFEELLDTVPRNTWITVTADHGECFGEGGYFGHGPIQHEKVLEVPFVEGRVR